MADTVVKMPQLGESVAEGTIGRWLKQPGRPRRARRAAGRDSDRQSQRRSASPVAGILQQILLPEGTTAAVTTDMAIIGDDRHAADDAPASQRRPCAATRLATAPVPARHRLTY